MVNYKMRIEAEYEAIDIQPQRIEPLVTEITQIFEDFKKEINKIII